MRVQLLSFAAIAVLLGPLLQAVGDNELLIEFVRWLLTSAGAGAAVFATIEELQKLWPSSRPPLSSDAKFYLAWALSFVYPLIAYFAQLAILGLAWSWGGLFAAIAVGYMASQQLHRGREKEEKAAATPSGDA